jgi:hypothetical protein
MQLSLDEQTGSLAALHTKEKQLLCEQAGEAPLFDLRLIDQSGQFSNVSAHDARAVAVAQDTAAGPGTIIGTFADFADYPGLTVMTRLAIDADQDQLNWNLSLINDTDFIIEIIDYPRLVVPSDVGPGPTQAKIFWPFTEGCVVEDISLSRFRAHPLLYPSSGGDPVYPGAITMQFMAYYDSKGGIYFAAHDPEPVPKAIECFPDRGGIRLSFKAFCAVDRRSTYTMPYPMVMQAFHGDWLDAAEIYRCQVEQSYRLPAKTWQRTDLPTWQKASPIVVIYPPRSIRGTGYMGPNEFFPYENAIKYLDDLAEAIDAQLLTLLTYWEGSAPWAPPYIWPPYGGEASFLSYVRQMHERGHYIGVYGSGIGWTDESLLCPEYTMRAFREENHLTECVCTGPDGSMVSKLCVTIRNGLDLCPACETTRDIAVAEVAKVLGAGVDFIQFFDQNIGGRGYACYSDRHGHLPAYGAWSVQAMKEIYGRINTMIASGGYDSAIGCESSPADCFIADLTYNDLRYNWACNFGRPVPALSYVFHEYLINFMGNQCAFTKTFPIEKNPDSLLFRLAYSLIAGDQLTLVIKSGGEIHWEWGMSWLQPGPRQKNILTAVRNFNAMRKGRGLPFLNFGRMLKPNPISCANAYVLTRNDGSQLVFEGLPTSKWQAPDGSVAQFIANHYDEPMRVQVRCHCRAAFGPLEDLPWQAIDEQTIEILVPALSCVALRLA